MINKKYENITPFKFRIFKLYMFTIYDGVCHFFSKNTRLYLQF